MKERTMWKTINEEETVESLQEYLELIAKILPLRKEIIHTQLDHSNNLTGDNIKISVRGMARSIVVCDRLFQSNTTINPLAFF